MEAPYRKIDIESLQLESDFIVGNNDYNIKTFV